MSAPKPADSSNPTAAGTLSGGFYVVLVSLFAVCALASAMGWVYDIPLLCGLVLSAGFVWTAHRRAALVTAVILLPIGLFCSSYDVRGCSAWWRGQIFVAKATGELPYVDWSSVISAASSGCYSIASAHPAVAEKMSQLGERVINGQSLELYQTELGKFWIAAPGYSLLSFLTWEMAIQRTYEHGPVRIEAGDIVVDCGAHVGVFTKYALSRGASRVIAIEPEPTNIACLKENLAEEIASGRVTLLQRGVWDVKDELAFEVSTNSAGHHVVGGDAKEGDLGIIRIPVSPLDELVRELALERVDFIKMDIEGSEARALRGAEATLRKFRPRLAICSYHGEQDPRDLPEIVRSMGGSYQVSGREVETQFYRVRPKVLYFHAEGSPKKTAPAPPRDGAS